MHIQPEKEKNVWFTPQELRMIAISLSVLALGTAIAWIGFLLVSQ